jgi:hypothetical protein
MVQTLIIVGSVPSWRSGFEQVPSTISSKEVGFKSWKHKATRQWVLLTCLKFMRIRYTAIMRGAVLHKLGLNFVKERLMRVSYGIIVNELFREGYHPWDSRVIDVDGVPRCTNLLNWFVRRVLNRTRFNY